MVGFAVGAFLGFIIGRIAYKPIQKRNKLNNSIFARDIFPKRNP